MRSTMAAATSIQAVSPVLRTGGTSFGLLSGAATTAAGAGVATNAMAGDTAGGAVAAAGAAAEATGALASSASTTRGAMTKAMTMQKAIKDFPMLHSGALKAGT